jgi:hypothetical protein
MQARYAKPFVAILSFDGAQLELRGMPWQQTLQNALGRADIKKR